MEKNYLQRMEESIMTKIVNEEVGCVYVVPTGGGKTYNGILKICKNLGLSNKKVIQVILNPFDILRKRIKFDLNRIGIETMTKNEFCSTTSSSSLIVVNDTWQSFIMEDSYKISGDNPSFMEKIQNLREKGYSIVFTIDETHIFSTLEIKKAPKAKEFISDIHPNTQIHFSATPGDVFNMGLEKFVVSADEVVSLGFVKKQIIVSESESPYKRIDSSLDEYENVCNLYERLEVKTTPKYMIVLPTKTKKNDSYDLYLKYFREQLELRGYDKDSIYHLDVHGKEGNEISIDDMSILDGENTSVRFLVTIQSGLTGLDVHSLEVGCVMSNLNETQQIQLTGRFVRNLNESTQKVYPTIFVSHTQSFTCYGGYEDQVKNRTYVLNEEINHKFPIAVISNKYVETISILDCFEDQISQINLVETGYQDHNGKEVIKYETLVNSGNTINPYGESIVSVLDLDTCTSKVNEVLKSFTDLDKFKIKSIIKKHFGFDSFEDMFNKISQQSNLSELSRILDICKNRINDNRNVSQEIVYDEITLPKQIKAPSGKYSTYVDDGIYVGDLQFDEEGERMCFLLLNKKGFRVFRNHGIIKIPYIMDGKYFTYEPDFVGFNPENKICVLDRKGKSVPIDQKKSIPYKSNAAEKLGYVHYIVTEISDSSKKNVYLWNKSDDFKSYIESPESWITIKSI
jgi:hypothetical protein